MTQHITVREYARLTTDPVPNPSLDRAQVSATAFDWLCRLNSGMSAAGASLVQIDDRRWLRLDNYVGVLETPCGTVLEILPKHEESADTLPGSRALLQRMITAALDLPVREGSETALERFDAPLSEWVIAQFLAALDRLVKRGVRSDYVRVEDSERFLRGQLNVSQQVRQSPGKQHVFQILHDVFIHDRAENRLLRLAVELACRTTKSPTSWRLAQELRSLFQEVPPSRNAAQDFQRWRTDRLMAHYQTLKPWCELVLSQQMPLSTTGGWLGISLLFPMEKLFERYVETMLTKQLAEGARLSAQVRSQYLCVHEGHGMFQLRPDFVITQGEKRWVLDTKWKLVNGERKANKYGLSQADFYQLFAYSHKYLGGSGELFLIYPRRRAFLKPLPEFQMGPELKLSVIPFDLEKGRLIGQEGISPIFAQH
ncbi:McrC family protein [Cupriavidus sp. 2SB]|uniref:McrC family protein n=1 Tax=Cupriavidus sp. 2SB TaxID=2502199 RepID=UPI0010F50430|nr:McrC family protein [Cupriavidus sp. 2SB]